MKLTRNTALAVTAVLCSTTVLAADVNERTLNDGQLLLYDIPEIPASVAADLNRFQNTRSASFQAWSEDSKRVFVTTRFGDVSQIHRVDQPGGARRQLTFLDEPVGGVARRPGSNDLAFLMDAGGSEFAQIFLLDAKTGDVRMLSDGESRNSVLLWDRDGERLAFQSTRRDGRANDIWIMQGDSPDSAGIALASTDGSWWGPSDFNRAGDKLLLTNYHSITDSRAILLDLTTGQQRRVDGGEERASTNVPIGFNADGSGFYFITDQFGEFNTLAYRDLADDAQTVVVTEDIPWNVTGLIFNDARDRAAFVINEGGLSALYLMDPVTRAYQRVTDLPVGVIGGGAFSPDDSSLALTLNSATSPSDTYVLTLGERPLQVGELTRWTYSEVGGLDTEQFVAPELISYPTFDEVAGEPREIPAFVYKPRGEGPFPVIISIHGGPEAQARPTFSSTFQMWAAKLGAAVVVPNVRGSAGYGKTYVGLDNGFKREDSVRDIGALLDWIATQPSLDAERVAVFGGSYGGYMVLASSVKYSDRLRAAVNVVGISNFVTFLENTQDYRRDLRRVEYGDERDPAMRAHLEQISPLNNVEQISVPMFVVQGNNDPRVPVSEAAQIVDALRESDNTVWYMNALNEGHGYARKENADVYRQAVVLFFQQHLLPEN
ncbi:MAG: alpha/beta fold hydrolase [Pseudomonadota bacterium]